MNEPMFMVGRVYKTVDGNEALILGSYSAGTSYETVFSLCPTTGQPIHRYNRRDFGRVTGTDATNPHPQNLVTI